MAHHRRKMRRFPLLCAVQYVGSTGAGEGVIEDVSLEGLRVTGNYAVQADTFLTLLLYLPDGSAPAKVPGASVRWVHGTEFGVKLPPLTGTIRQRLLRYFGVQPGQAHRLFEDSATAPSATEETEATLKPTALIVHPDPSILEQAAALLTREGFTVLHAPGSSEALHVTQMLQGDVDLLVVDALLPVPELHVAPPQNPFPRVNGEELVKRVLQRSKSLRVIVLSADSRMRLWKVGSHGATLPSVRVPFTDGTFLPVLQQVMSRPALIYHEPTALNESTRTREIQWVG